MRLIFRYFIYSRKCYHHSRFLDWGGRSPRALDPLLTLALYFRLRSSWRFKSQGPGLAKKFINPFITFTFHRGLKIRINRPRSRTTFTRITIRHICSMYTREKYNVTWSKSKLLRRMTHEAAFRRVFPAKKGTKRHSKHIVSVSMRYPRHLDGIPKKWPVSRQLLFNVGSNHFRIELVKSGAHH